MDEVDNGEVVRELDVANNDDQIVLMVGNRTYRSRKAVSRRLKVFRLRTKGWTYRKISDALGISEARACKLASDGAEIYHEYLTEGKAMKKLINTLQLDSFKEFHLARALDPEYAASKSPELYLKAVKIQNEMEGLNAPIDTRNLNVSGTMDDLLNTLGMEGDG